MPATDFPKTGSTPHEVSKNYCLRVEEVLWKRMSLVG